MKWISPFLFEVWSTLCTLIGTSSFMVGSECFLTNCQSMQEMSTLLSIRAQVSMTFNVCDGVMSCNGILIAFGMQDTNTGAHVMKGELCVK